MSPARQARQREKGKIDPERTSRSSPSLCRPPRGKTTTDRKDAPGTDMRIYSSLPPLDLHARGAELCRVVLLRDADCMRNFGHRAPPLSYRQPRSLTPSAAVYDRIQSFTIGPVIAPLDTCGFASYDDGSLYHHAVQTYLQLCVRYPAFRDGKVRPAVRSSVKML